MSPSAQPPSLPPESEVVLAHVASWGLPTAPTVADARRAEDRRQLELGGTGPEMAEIFDLTLPGPAGEVPVRVYRPQVEAPVGVLVWLHGGAWTVGSPRHAETQTRGLAQASGCVVVSVDYRLAPEHPFPAAPEDCYAAVTWVAEHGERLGAGGGLVVGGDSAGGNLTAAVTLMARERGGPRIDGQLLVYPAVACELDALSRRRYAQGFWLTMDGVRWAWGNYLAGGGDPDDALVSPLRAESLAGLPPAVVVLAECDVLHDEGLAYAERLRDEGVAVDVHDYPGMLHGFLAAAGVVPTAHVALEAAGAAVRRLVDRAAAPAQRSSDMKAKSQAP